MDFPDAWRTTCIEILCARRSELREKAGKGRLSWQAVRDEMMRPYEFTADERTSHDSRIIRQDLANFAARRDTRSDKLKIIDNYVRELDAFGNSDKIRRMIVSHQDRENLKAFSGIYTSADIDRKLCSNIFNNIPKISYVERFEGGWFASSFVIVDEVTEFGIIVTIGYCPVPLNDLTLDHHKEIIFYKAYMIPIGYDHEIDDLLNGIAPMETRTLDCVVRAHRPEFRGSPALGYADGEARISYFRLLPAAANSDADELEMSSVKLDYPNPLTYPSLGSRLDPNRYKLGKGFQLKRKYGNDKPESGMTESDPVDWHDTEVWRMELNTNREYDNLIESVINISYKGYVF